MKCSDLPSIYRTLATAQSYKVLAIEGGDDFFREDCAARSIESWRGAFPQGEVFRLSGSEFVSRRSGLLSGASLFGTRQLYCIEGTVKVKKGDDVLTSIQTRDESCDLLFVDSEAFPKELSGYAEQEGAYFSFPPIKPWDKLPLQVNWIQSYVKKRGQQIDSNGATILAKGYAQDRQGLIGELEKLMTYCLGVPMILASHVERIGVVELQPTLWQLLDALLAGDTRAVAICVTQSTDLYDIAVVRFLKNQFEKLVITVEEGAPSRNRSQEKQLSVVRKRGLPTIISWINRLKMHEVGIRSGTEEVQEGTLLPFLMSLARSRS